MKYSYWRQFLIALDQMVNALFAGWADETISARAWRQRLNYKRWRFGRAAIDFVFFWQKGHCQLAYQDEIRRLQLPVDERGNPRVF